jgi:hypothetical protein
LEKHGVEVGFLQSIQDVAQFLLLLADTFRIRSLLAGPVHTSQGGEPSGTDFVFRLGFNRKDET